MDEVTNMRGFERVGDLSSNRERFGKRQRTWCNAIGKRRPFDELHHESALITRSFDAVDLCDIGMIQRGQGFGFTLKARQPL